MLFTFQIAVFALIALSFVLVVRVPVVCAQPLGWAINKGSILSGTSLWFLLVLVVGVLNFFVV